MSIINTLVVGQQTILVQTRNEQRNFEVSLRPDNKLEVMDLETGNEHAISMNSITCLTSKGYEDSESLEILIYLKDSLEDSLKTTFSEIAKVVENISEVYPSPDWVIGEIMNMKITDLFELFKSEIPVQTFKDLAC